MKDLNAIATMWIDNLNIIGIYPNKVSRFEVNSRALRRWGQTKRKDGIYTISINYLLLEDDCPEEALTNTLVHELLHCVDGCMNHGEKWQKLVEIVNDCYDLKMSRCTSTSEKFANDEEYGNKVLQAKMAKRKTYTCVCKDCGIEYQRIGERAPKWYAHYENYHCSKCGGKLEKR